MSADIKVLRVEAELSFVRGRLRKLDLLGYLAAISKDESRANLFVLADRLLNALSDFDEADVTPGGGGA